MMTSYSDSRVGRAFIGSAKTADKIKLNFFEDNDFFGMEVSSISLKEEALKKASEAKSENDESPVQKKQKN